MSYAQQRIDSSLAAMAYALEPLFAVLFSVFLFDATISSLQWTGLLLLVVANVASNLHSATSACDDLPCINRN